MAIMGFLWWRSRRRPQPHQHDPFMRSWCKTMNVGKVQVLSDEEPPRRLRCSPHLLVRLSSHAFLRNGVSVISQRSERPSQCSRKVLVKFNLHAICGMPGRGRSSSAEAAAKAMTARTAPSVKVGKSSRMAWMLAPSARPARIVRMVTRVL